MLLPDSAAGLTCSPERDSDHVALCIMQYSKEFGYSRKDVILVGVGLLVAGVLLYNGLQALGIPAIRAGNYVQIIFVLGLCIAWVASYVFRVANKVCSFCSVILLLSHRKFPAITCMPACAAHTKLRTHVRNLRDVLPMQLLSSYMAPVTAGGILDLFSRCTSCKARPIVGIIPMAPADETSPYGIPFCIKLQLGQDIHDQQAIMHDKHQHDVHRGCLHECLQLSFQQLVNQHCS